MTSNLPPTFNENGEYTGGACRAPEQILRDVAEVQFKKLNLPQVRYPEPFEKINVDRLINFIMTGDKKTPSQPQGGGQADYDLLKGTRTPYKPIKEGFRI